MLDLDMFCLVVSERFGAWADRGVQARLDRSPDDGRPKASAWVVVDAGRSRGELIVWDSGEGELEFLDADGHVTLKHFDDLGNDSVQFALADLEALLPQASG